MKTELRHPKMIESLEEEYIYKTNCDKCGQEIFIYPFFDEKGFHLIFEMSKDKCCKEMSVKMAHIYEDCCRESI